MKFMNFKTDFFCSMREFAIYDNNDYLLQFGQVIASNE